MTPARSRPVPVLATCSHCGQPIRSIPTLEGWIADALLRGARLYCSPACTVASERDSAPGAPAPR